MYSGDEVYDDDVTSGQIKEIERIGMDADNASVETIDITPNWENTAKFFAYMFAEHGFASQSYQPMASFIEQIAHLSKTDPDSIKTLIAELNAKGVKVEVKIDRHNHVPEELTTRNVDQRYRKCEICRKDIELIDSRWELTARA